MKAKKVKFARKGGMSMRLFDKISEIVMRVIVRSAEYLYEKDRTKYRGRIVFESRGSMLTSLGEQSFFIVRTPHSTYYITDTKFGLLISDRQEVKIFLPPTLVINRDGVDGVSLMRLHESSEFIIFVPPSNTVKGILDNYKTPSYTDKDKIILN